MVQQLVTKYQSFLFDFQQRYRLYLYPVAVTEMLML